MDDPGKGLPPTPTLSRLSDALFLIWQNACQRSNTGTNNLKYIIRNYVSLGVSVPVGNRVAGGPLQPFPGVFQSMDGEGGWVSL